MKKLLRLMAMLLALLPLTACGVSSSPIEGRVLDAETKKPIAGAIVIARWDGTYSALVDSHTVCYHVETATTDKDGRYKIPGWWEEPKGPFFGEGPMYLDAYKPGYEKYWPAGYDRTEDFKNNVLYLAPFKGTKEERLTYLLQMGGKEWVSPNSTDTFIKLVKIEGNVRDGANGITQEIQPGVQI